MTLLELIDLQTKGSRLLGLDVGDKTIGIAMSDTSWTIATPLQTVNRKSYAHDLEIFQKLIKDYAIIAIVVGLPLNMNGTEGPQVGKVRDLANRLSVDLKLPLYFQDERLSTVAVERTLLLADMSRLKRDKVIDKMAASFILQGVLDQLSMTTN